MTQTFRRFTRRQEDFSCLNCGHLVRGTGYTNHCPRCLWSCHVDISPGDRLAQCQSPMEPVGALYEGGDFVVVQRCVACGHMWRNRASANDSRKILVELASRVVDWSPPTPRNTKRKNNRPKK